MSASGNIILRCEIAFKKNCCENKNELRLCTQTEFYSVYVRWHATEVDLIEYLVKVPIGKF